MAIISDQRSVSVMQRNTFIAGFPRSTSGSPTQKPPICRWDSAENAKLTVNRRDMDRISAGRWFLTPEKRSRRGLIRHTGEHWVRPDDPSLLFRDHTIMNLTNTCLKKGSAGHKPFITPND
jgi:hypothetical protein